MRVLLVLLPAVMLVAVIAAIVGWAARAPHAAPGGFRVKAVVLRATETYLLIMGIAVLGLGLAGIGLSTAGFAEGNIWMGTVVGAILLACWSFVRQTRRNREQRR